MNILVTGSNGFIGRALISHFLTNGRFNVTAAVRTEKNIFPLSVKQLVIGDFPTEYNWRVGLQNIDCIVHLAGRAHILSETKVNPLDEFRYVNVNMTLDLAREARKAGVRRFIFISSIGVNGSSTVSAFSEMDEPRPIEPYAISKFEAEIGLQNLFADSDVELVIIRPPLVYGPGAPGNFRRLIHAVAKGIPLPLGAINNKRTLIALDNLVDLITICLEHPAAANQIFLAGDGVDLSTTELLQRMATALGVVSRLIPVPVWILQSGASVVGKADMARRLCGSLQVDISKAREVLGWQPPVNVDDALLKTARAFLGQKPL